MTFSLAEQGTALLGILPHQPKDEVRGTKVTDGSASAWKEAHVVLCVWEEGRLVTCMLDRGSHQWLIRQTRFNLNERAESLIEPLYSMSPTSHFTLTLSSILYFFLLLWPSSTENGGGTKKEQRDLESGLLDSADHQQLRAYAYMKSREEEQGDIDSCSPTALSPCLVPHCGLEQEPGVGMVWGILWGAGPHSWTLCPLDLFAWETDHRKSLCDAWDWETCFLRGK